MGCRTYCGVPNSAWTPNDEFHYDCPSWRRTVLGTTGPIVPALTVIKTKWLSAEAGEDRCAEMFDVDQCIGHIADNPGADEYDQSEEDPFGDQRQSVKARPASRLFRAEGISSELRKRAMRVRVRTNKPDVKARSSVPIWSFVITRCYLDGMALSQS